MLDTKASAMVWLDSGGRGDGGRMICHGGCAPHLRSLPLVAGEPGSSWRERNSDVRSAAAVK